MPSAPAWWIAEQAELRREFADMDRYYAEIDAQDAIDAKRPTVPVPEVECALCFGPSDGGLCGRCAHGFENAGRY